MNQEEKKKRKVLFKEFDEEIKKQKKTSKNTRLHSGQYTLDSDEEDDEEKEGNETELNQDDYEGTIYDISH